MTANRRRIVIGAAFAGALLIAVTFPEFRRGLVSMTKPDPIGPAIYSKSALGHAAVYDMLAGIGIPVVESDLGSGAHFEPNSVTVIAEPRTDDTTLTDVRAMLDAPTVLLVLPKREGKADPKRPNWIGEDRLIAPSDVQRVLSLADQKATLVRDAAGDSWNVSRFSGTQPAIHHPQLMHSARLRPLLAGPEGMLIGEIREHGRRLVVLSDPGFDREPWNCARRQCVDFREPDSEHALRARWHGGLRRVHPRLFAAPVPHAGDSLSISVRAGHRAGRARHRAAGMGGGGKVRCAARATAGHRCRTPQLDRCRRGTGEPQWRLVGARFALLRRDGARCCKSVCARPRALPLSELVSWLAESGKDGAGVLPPARLAAGNLLHGGRRSPVDLASVRSIADAIKTEIGKAVVGPG